MTTASTDGRRPYRSARRQQQAARTRELVLTAATSLFAERGWSGTGMRDVAREAGVALETVYANFRSKPELLLAAIDAGVVGDAAPVPLSDRPEFAAIGEGRSADRIAAAARLVRGINQRNVGLRRALDEAAASDAQLAARLAELEGHRWTNTRDAVEMLLERPVDDDEIDAVWAVTGAQVFDLVTRVRGRSAEDYERWLAGAMTGLLAGADRG